MNNVTSAVAAALACAALASPAESKVSTSGIDGVFAPFTKSGEPGCSVGVFEKGKPLLMRGYGSADIAAAKPLQADTVFYAASTSKQFTALSIALLAQDGKLKLEDDVRRWVPELPDYGTPITIAMLLHHTSGLGDFLSLFSLAGTEHFDKLDPPTTLAMIVRQKGLQFPPGTQYRYSNTGYFLLAQIVSRISGKTFPQFVHDRILAPLGMKDSYMRNGANPPESKVAHGYVPESSSYVIRDTYPGFGGSGGLMTSIRDLQKFDRDFQVGHKIWSDPVRKTMLTPGRFNNGEPVATDGMMYAAGLQVGTKRGLEWVSHSGSAAAFRSEYVRLPTKQLGIAVLCNRGDATPGTYVEKVIDTLGIGPLQGAWDAPNRRERSEAAGGKPLTPVVVEALRGRYRSPELAADYVFATDGGGKLKATVSSRYATGESEPRFGELQMLSGDTLTGEGFFLHLARDARGNVQGFSLEAEGMRSLEFERVPAS